MVYKRSTAYAYEAVLLFRKGDFEGGAMYLKKAGQYARHSRDPVERCLYSRIFGLITQSSDCPCESRLKIGEDMQTFDVREERSKISSIWERKYLDQFCIF